MLPHIIGPEWINVIVLGFLFGFGFAAGSALFSGVLGLFKRGA